MGKISVLENDFVDKSYHSQVLPRLLSEGIPVSRSSVLPVIRTYDEKYWGSLRAIHKIDIAILDPKSWHFDDEIFSNYVKQVSSVKFNAVCLFESPFGIHRPSVESSSFERKLFSRTEEAVAEIKRRYKHTVILAPSISVIANDYRNMFIDYLVENRSLFDAYALHCVGENDEQSLSFITGILNEALIASPKETWITKWAVPTFEGNIKSLSMMPEPKLLNYSESAQRLKQVYLSVERVTKGKSRWFYTGIGKDLYRPHLTPGPDEYWHAHASEFIRQELKSEWNPEHFLGMITHDDKLKNDVLNGFINLFHQYSDA